jgi:hypothetical protein
MLATRRSTALAIESPVGIQIICFEVTIDTFAAGTCGSTAWGGLDHHERRLILLRNLRWR